MRNLLGTIITTLCLILMPLQTHAAKPSKATKVAQPTKERLVLMAMRLSEEDKNLQGAMETALVEGLQQKYEVFSGEQVAKKAKEIFNKESRTAKHDCDATRCMQDIAEAFQAELIATTNVTKREDGYFLALSIQNIFDNKVVYSKSTPCQNCNAYQVIDKLKELGGVSTAAQSPTASDIPDMPVMNGKALDSESAQWVEVQKGNSIEDYEAYLSQYPKGKYAILAKGKIKKLKEQEAAELAKQDQNAWDSASSKASEASYQSYLILYPQGNYATLAQARIAKFKKEAAADRVRQLAETEYKQRETQSARGSAAMVPTYVQASYGDMPEQAKRLNCTACHSISRKVVGPAWIDVSRRYKGDASAEAQLIAKVSKGGSGSWGSMPMPANDAAGTKQADIRGLVQFILGLAK